MAQKLVLNDLCVEILQKCPNKCIYCSSNSDLTKEDIIDYKTFTQTILYLQEKCEIKEISISGGEPLLHKDIYKIVDFCTKNAIKSTIYTSGVLFDEDFHEIYKKNYRMLEVAGVSKIVFDIQTVDDKTYNELMGTENNLTFAKKSIENAKEFGFEKSIHFIPNKLNYKQFSEVLDFAEKMDISELRVLKFVPQGRGRENAGKLLMSDEELQKFIEEIKKIKTKNTNIRIGIPLFSNAYHICTAGNDKLHIRFDGQVLPCPAFKDMNVEDIENFKCVNIYKNLSDLEIKNQINAIPLCQKYKRHIYQKGEN